MTTSLRSRPPLPSTNTFAAFQDDSSDDEEAHAVNGVKTKTTTPEVDHVSYEPTPPPSSAASDVTDVVSQDDGWAYVTPNAVLRTKKEIQRRDRSFVTSSTTFSPTPSGPSPSSASASAAMLSSTITIGQDAFVEQELQAGVSDVSLFDEGDVKGLRAKRTGTNSKAMQFKAKAKREWSQAKRDEQRRRNKESLGSNGVEGEHYDSED